MTSVLSGCEVDELLVGTAVVVTVWVTALVVVLITVEPDWVTICVPVVVTVVVEAGVLDDVATKALKTAAATITTAITTELVLDIARLPLEAETFKVIFERRPPLINLP